QPYVVAVMLEALELEPADRVLEVGAGSGYAAAVMSRIVDSVYAIERYRSLADQARARMDDLGYDNVRIRAGDGTLGWPEEAPFDAIAVAAGGPEVPRPLLEQLAIGGRLVIPAGEQARAQRLIRVTRVDEHEFEEVALGSVQFVPLIGSAGWALDGRPARDRRPGPPLRVEKARRTELVSLIDEGSEPFGSWEQADLDPLLDRIGDARVVLVGEASHGTSEFYRMRARVTRELIERKEVDIVALEGDWPDVASIDAHVRPGVRRSVPSAPFRRFPTWMWRNRETRTFVDWLREHNAQASDRDRQVSMYGLDLYSLSTSIAAVLDFLDRVDPEAARVARVRYACFSPWETDPAVYGRAVSAGRLEACEDEVVDVLQDLLAKRLEYAAADGAAVFDAERNATVVREAERYYRAMYRGGRESWNLRDTHMFDVLTAALEHRGPDAKAVVWAHNSHVRDARATEMGRRGELNIGQLARESFGVAAFNIGFGTHRGTVAAASNWDEPVQRMKVRPSHPDSYERLCHDTDRSGFLLPLRHPAIPEVREGLLAPHLERAIGVIYRPESELVSHYFQAALPAQFDEYVWIDETTALEPLATRELAGVPDTYPFAL
ncbi:MAG: protein-L-isoaspartate O-methyltransferase, partial [Longimicrobiales bacterium]|nr:protein-L-isoaspartate O-methyltransferase [Longimicrobiales bacterium]